MKSLKNVIPAPRAAATKASQQAGQIIGERYQLEELLESGAMGSVWRAEQTRLRSKVAVKFLEPALIGDPEMHDRFMQEARSAASVRSMHVVQIFDYGSEEGVPYIAMELLEGENLNARLSSRGTLTPLELNKIFSEVARGIGQAHAMGVVHRDVKPGNIFIAREGEHEVTKLIDFGIAKVKADALKFTHIVGTQLGTLLGTPQYMSPEQLRGSNLVDHRTDLWALAIIACECLTGRYPFPGTTIGDLTVQICTEKPRAPSTLGHVPPGFDQWFFKGTSKKALRRFESVEEMAGALTKVLLGSNGGVPTVAWSQRLLGLWRRFKSGPGWVTASSHVEGISTLARRALGRSDPGSLIETSVIRVTPFALTPLLERLRFRLAQLAERQRSLWPLLTRKGLAGSAVLLLLLTAGLAFALFAGRETQPLPTEQEGPFQRIQSASPMPLLPAPLAAAAAVDTVVPSLPTVAMTGQSLMSPSSAVAEAAPEQAPTPAAPRRGKREEAPARADAETPFGPMSLAMGRAGARIMAGDTHRTEARSTPAQPLARNRGTTTKAAPKALAPDVN